MLPTPTRPTVRVLPRRSPRPLADAPALAVIGVGSDGQFPPSVTPDQQAALTAALHRSGTPLPLKHGQVVALPAALLPQTAATLIVGTDSGCSPAQARTLGGALAVALRGLGDGGADLDLPLGPEAAVECLSALRLRLWQAPTYATKADPLPPTVTTLHWRSGNPASAAALWQAAEAVCEGVELARDLQTLPANILTVQTFIDHARALSALGVEVEILDRKDLQAAGMGLHLAVGQASATPPALAVLRWRGGPAGVAPTLLVGKGLCFDTGGICLKPAGGMEEMKGDMGGAAAVIGTVHALARQRAPVSVTGLLALAENAIGENAYRPGDILSSHSGLSVEVIDTDAEGRLVLADALSWGCATEKPAAVVDLATLTGSIIVALGHDHAGLFCRHDRDGDSLAAALTDSGQRSGEALWRMPLSERWDEALKSDAADLRHCAPAARLIPDALHAARFLSRFVPDGVPFAHLDIAGPSEIRRPLPWAPAGATGFGVRLLVDWLTR